jgi:molybdenum cofactor guanylyltransferase
MPVCSPKNHKCSGVILAGGESKRFFGRTKALIRIGGKRAIDRIYSVFEEVFDDILIITNTPAYFEHLGGRKKKDLFPVRSSLTGIHAGLYYAKHPHVFVSGCDAPFLKKDIINVITGDIQSGMDAIVPRTTNGLEPLCAVYSKRCLHTIESHLLAHRFRIRLVLNKHTVGIVPENRLRKIDSNLLSFFNMNTPWAMIQAETVAGKKNKNSSTYLIDQSAFHPSY